MHFHQVIAQPHCRHNIRDGSTNHCSALLDPVTAGSDAVFFVLFFSTASPPIDGEHQHMRTWKQDSILIFMVFNSVISSHDGTALKYRLGIY